MDGQLDPHDIFDVAVNDQHIEVLAPGEAVG
jgi:hypothetical protein